MNHQDIDLPFTVPAPVRLQPFSPRVSLNSATPTPTAGAQRRIAIAVDLSDESANAVNWTVQNYLRTGDAVILLHVRPTNVLYGADWGSIQGHINPSNNSDDDSTDDPSQQQKLEDDFDNFTITKTNSLAQALVEAQIPFKIHIVKDHDMKERLCLEVERLGLSAVIMGSRGFGAARRNSKGRLGSVSDYCVRHCVCPVVVVRYPDEKENGAEGGNGGESLGVAGKKGIVGEAELHPVPEEEPEYHGASYEQPGLGGLNSKLSLQLILLAFLFFLIMSMMSDICKFPSVFSSYRIYSQF